MVPSTSESEARIILVGRFGVHRSADEPRPLLQHGIRTVLHTTVAHLLTHEPGAEERIGRGDGCIVEEVSPLRRRRVQQ